MNASKVVIVTGGTGALGSVVTRKFASAEFRVYVPVRSIEKFRRVFDSSQDEGSMPDFRKIYGLPCNAEDENEVARFIEDVIKREGQIDCLVNTVGGFHRNKKIHEMDSELIGQMMRMNFYSTFYFCRYVLPEMIKSKHGRIIAVAAKPAIEIIPGKFAYSISKQAVVNLINTIAEECRDYGISAGVIVPNIIDTESNRSSMPDADFSGWTAPEDIASVIYSFATGQTIPPEGNIIKTYGCK